MVHQILLRTSSLKLLILVLLTHYLFFYIGRPINLNLRRKNWRAPDSSSSAAAASQAENPNAYFGAASEFGPPPSQESDTAPQGTAQQQVDVAAEARRRAQAASDRAEQQQQQQQQEYQARRRMTEHQRHQYVKAQQVAGTVRDHETMNDVGDDEMGGTAVYGVVEDVDADDLDL